MKKAQEVRIRRQDAIKQREIQKEKKNTNKKLILRILIFIFVCGIIRVSIYHTYKYFNYDFLLYVIISLIVSVCSILGAIMYIPDNDDITIFDESDIC